MACIFYGPEYKKLNLQLVNISNIPFQLPYPHSLCNIFPLDHQFWTKITKKHGQSTCEFFQNLLVCNGLKWPWKRFNKKDVTQSLLFILYSDDKKTKKQIKASFFSERFKPHTHWILERCPEEYLFKHWKMMYKWMTNQFHITTHSAAVTVLNLFAQQYPRICSDRTKSFRATLQNQTVTVPINSHLSSLSHCGLILA